MTKLTKIKLWLSAIVLLSACIGGYVYYQMQQKTILKIGVYAGSSWDVPNGNDYKVIDTAIKRFEVAVSENREDAQEYLVKAIKALDKAASKGVIHKNAAARKKSRLTKKLAAASQQ